MSSPRIEKTNKQKQKKKQEPNPNLRNNADTNANANVANKYTLGLDLHQPKCMAHFITSNSGHKSHFDT